MDQRSAQAVIFRFYGGMQIEEIAEELEISPRTVKRDLRYGRAWLHAELTSRSPEAKSGLEDASST
jgi:RNA polymerase sigma-70 factor, ECF subfamily